MRLPKHVMKTALRILVSVGLLTLVIVLADWKAVVAVLRGVAVGWVIAALSLAVLDRLTLNYRWQLLLGALGVPIAFGKLLRVQLAANFLGSFLPTSVGVDAVRVASLCRSGQPMAPVVAATLVDRATIVIATLLFGSTMILALAGARIPPRLEESVLACTGVVMALGVVVLLPPVRRRVRLALLPRVPARFGQMLAAIAGASLSYRNQGRTLGWVALVTVLLLIGRVLLAKALALACGADVPFGDLLMIIPILWILVMLPITIGGLGVQDAGYVALMALVGVGAPIAVAMSLLEHLLTRAVSLPGAFLIDTRTSKDLPGGAKKPISSGERVQIAEERGFNHLD